MNENEKVYEIASIMGNNQLFKGDVNTAASLVRNMLTEKYITPIHKAMEKENKRARKNPNKEAQLLHALKPFMPSANHKAIEETIEAIHLIETLRGIQKQMPSSSPSPSSSTGPRTSAIAAQEVVINEVADPSVHPDGVYDMDEKCLNTPKEPMIPLFLVFLMAMSRGR